MILYLDTSSLVKLYAEEAHSDLVREWAGLAEGVATSPVAYAEASSALARRRARGDLDETAFTLALESLEKDWSSFILLPLREWKAGELAVKHLLRGFDAIHLAAAIRLRRSRNLKDCVFSSFDKSLLEAARREGIDILQPV